MEKTNKKEIRIEKIIKKKAINYMLNGKVLIIHLMVEFIKKILLFKNELFSTYKYSNKICLIMQQNLTYKLKKDDLKMI